LVKDGFFSTVIWPETARSATIDGDCCCAICAAASRRDLATALREAAARCRPACIFELGPPVLNYVMRIECARRPIPKDPAWTGPGWIAIVNPGFRVAPALKAPAP
jgi:predicted metalloenzyme YecM